MLDIETKLRSELEREPSGVRAQAGALFALPSPEKIANTFIVSALLWMIWIDLKRPFQVSLLRLRGAGFGAWLACFFGLLPTRHTSLENVVRLARKQASISKRVLFLSRTKQVFQLWHVIHYPFSYAFAILALVHIGLVLFMGYRV